MLGTDQNVQNIQGKQENCPLCTVFTCYGYTFQNQHLNEIRWKQNMPVSSVLAVMITQQRTPWGRAFLPRVTAAAATLAVALKVKEQTLVVLAVVPKAATAFRIYYHNLSFLCNADPFVMQHYWDMEQHFPTKTTFSKTDKFQIETL